MRALKTTIGILGLALLGGCAGYGPNYDPYFHTKTGAVVGGLAGAVIGHQLDDDDGRYVGAAAGAVTGGAVGNYMDRHYQPGPQRPSPYYGSPGYGQPSSYPGYGRPYAGYPVRY